MKYYAQILQRLGVYCAVFSIFMSLYAPQMQAQTQDGGTENIVQEVGASARAFSLGRAYSAVVDDPSAVFWNPAGLEYVPRMSLELFHTPLVEGAIYDFIGFAYPTLNFGTVGLGLTRVGAGGDIILRDTRGAVLNAGDPADMDFIEVYVSYAKQLPLNIAAGITYKVQRQNFSGTNDRNSAFGLDAGLMYRPNFESAILKNLSVGLQFQNLYRPPLKLGITDDTLPYRFSLGLMKAIPVGLDGKLNVAVDFVKGEFLGGKIHAGTEYIFRNVGTVRLGFDENTPVFGAGMTYKMVDIDYSFGNLGTDDAFPAQHRFSLTFNVGYSREEKVQLALEERLRREKELVENTKEEERRRRVEQAMNKGTEDLNAGRIFEASTQFQQVIADDPFNKRAKVFYDSVRVLIESEFEERQQEAISQAVDSLTAAENRRFAKLHFDKGEIFLGNKQFNDALKEFNLVLERDPENQVVVDAINSTRRRLNQEVRTLVTRGRQEFQRGNYSAALEVLSEARVLSPDSEELKKDITTLANRIRIQEYIQRGLTLMQQGDLQEALNVFDEAQTLDPTNEAIRGFIERTRRGMGIGTEDMDPESERQYIIATDLFLKGRYREALDIWQKLAEKYPHTKKVQEAIKTAEERIKRTQ